FNHRIAAYVVVVAVLWRLVVVLASRRQRAQQTSALALALAVIAQLGLGIWTLLSQVPPLLGIAHQAMAASIFASAVWHLYEGRHPRAAPRCQSRSSSSIWTIPSTPSGSLRCLDLRLPNAGRKRAWV